MQSLLNTLRVLVAVLPAIVELVQSIERAVPIKGIGSDKLELMKEIVTDVYDSLEAGLKQGVSLAGVIQAAVSLANRFVALFNRVGWPA
jgi:hypothetical protein